MSYHVENGGVSRYKKFEYFYKTILKDDSSEKIQKSLIKFAEIVIEGLLKCDINKALFPLKEKFPNTKWVVVSGGDQTELQYIFNKRNLSGLFELGIFGSPKKKEEIVERLMQKGKLKKPILFIGDSNYDYEVAKFFKLDFLFLEEWSEFREWGKLTDQKNFFFEKSMKNLL